METSDDAISLENSTLNPGVGENSTLISVAADLAQSSQDCQNLDDAKVKEKENGTTAVTEPLESSIEKHNELQHEKEESENLKQGSDVQEPLSVQSTEAETSKDAIQNCESVQSLPNLKSAGNTGNGIEVSESSSVLTQENADKQPSSETTKENGNDLLTVTNAPDSASAKDTDEQTVNGCNKENENNALTSTPSSETLPSKPVHRNAEEIDSQNNSGDENALIIDDLHDQERPLDTESPLVPTQEPAKVLPQLAPNVAGKAPVKSARGRKPGTPRQPLKFDKEDLEHLRLPEKHGWKRELVYRGTFDQDSRKMDIYYHPPSGKKLRSMMDIGAYLDKQENYPLNRTHFTFRKEQLFEPPFELVRSAGQPVKAFSSPTSSKNRSSPSISSTPTTKKLSVKLPGLKTPNFSPRFKRTVVVRTNSPSISSTSTAVQNNVIRIPGAHLGVSVNAKTNGTGSNLPQPAHGALHYSQMSTNNGTAAQSQTSFQPGIPRPPIRVGFGFGFNNNKPSGNEVDKERPATTWRMKVTPRLNNKKIHPRPLSPEWRPSGESSISEDSEGEDNVEIIKHGVGDSVEDEMQRVMGTASDLIASIVRQSKPQAQDNRPTTTTGFTSSNKLPLPRITTSSIQLPRATLVSQNDTRMMLVHKLRASVNTTTATQPGVTSLLPGNLPKTLPFRILNPIYAPTPVSSVSVGPSSIFPPPPPLASCPGIRSAGAAPLRMVGLNPPPLVSMLPLPRLAGPRAPPALQPCPLLLDGTAPGRIISSTQPRPAPPPLAHRSFTPNILQRPGPQTSSQSPVSVLSLHVSEGTESKNTTSEEEKKKTCPAVNADSAELSVSSDDEEDVLCIDPNPPPEGSQSRASTKDLPSRKRPAPSDSDLSDEDNSIQSKVARVERRKSLEPPDTNAGPHRAVNIVTNKRIGEDKEEDRKVREPTQSSAVLRGILNKPPKAKNLLVLPKDNNFDTDSDEDDEFLPPVTFASEDTVGSEKDKAATEAMSISSSTSSTETSIHDVSPAILPSLPNKMIELANVKMPVKSFTSSAQLLTLPPGLREKLDLKRPLLLALNGQEIVIPPVHVLATQTSLKVLLPPGTNMSVSGLANTLSVAVSNAPKHAAGSGAVPKFPRRSYLASSFRPLQESVGIMTRLFNMFSLPHLLRLCQVNKAWLKMFYLPGMWQTVSFRNIHVKDWDKARKFLQKVCVKNLSLAGMVLRRDLEAKSWEQIETITPRITSLNGLHFGRVPANILMSLMEKMPENVNISADVIMDSNDPTINKMKVTMSKYSDKHVDNMSNALSSVEAGTLPADAARQFNVSESDILHLQQGRMYVLTPEEESLVVLCCIRLAQMGFTISISSFLIKCQEMFARRYSTAVPLPIFDGACRKIYQKNFPFFNTEQSQGCATNLVTALDRHYTRLNDLYDSISRLYKIKAQQVYTFDTQTFRLGADPQAVPRRAYSNVTMLWATDAENITVKPAMLVTATQLAPDQTHEKLIVVKAKNGVATPAHIQQYFRKLISSVNTFPSVVLCSTDASNFSESLVTMCLQNQVYIVNIPGDIAKLVFPGYQGGLLHMLKKDIPAMSLKHYEFLAHLKFLLQNCLDKIQNSTRKSYIVTGAFPLNRRAPEQYQLSNISDIPTNSGSPVIKTGTRSPRNDATLTQRKSQTNVNEEVELGDSCSEVDEPASRGDNNEELDSASSCDDEIVAKPQKTITASCRPSTLMSSQKFQDECVLEPALPSALDGEENFKSTEENHWNEDSNKVNTVKNLKKQTFSRLVVLARDLILKAKRGPIKRSLHRYKPLKPLKPALAHKDIIKKTMEGKNVISTLPFNPTPSTLPFNPVQFESLSQPKHSKQTMELKSSVEDESKHSEPELPRLVINTTHQETNIDLNPRVIAKPVPAESPSKSKALVCKHIQEAIDAVVEESREYARQVERGGSHGVEIMPEKWMKRHRETLGSDAQINADSNSTFVRKLGGTSLVLKTGIGKHQVPVEEEESDLEEEDDAEEEEEGDVASSNEDEGEGAVEWTVSSQPKHKENKWKKKKHRKQKKKHKKEEVDSEEETLLKDKENQKKRKKTKKKKKKKHKQKNSRSDLEDMDTSQESSHQKHGLNDNRLDLQVNKVDVTDNQMLHGGGSSDQTVPNTSATEAVELTQTADADSVKDPQPSHILDHDYFSKFVDEDCVAMEEIDRGIACEQDQTETGKESEQGTAGVTSEQIVTQSDTQHDDIKATEVQDVTDVNVVNEESSAPAEVSSSGSSDDSSDSDSSISGGHSDSSNSGSGSSSSSAEEESSESEPNGSSVSREQSTSPKKKVKKEWSSSESSGTSSGSDSSHTDSDSEVDEKKKKTSTSYESEENEDSDEEEDKCQLCMRATPPHSKDVLIDWVDCDKNCGRWFHVICINNSKFRSKSKYKNSKHYICPSCR